MGICISATWRCRQKRREVSTRLCHVKRPLVIPSSMRDETTRQEVYHRPYDAANCKDIRHYYIILLTTILISRQ